ncbi:hypothetical protein AAVH_17954 [Aphelenchoides avenae]|nr:hypothetical protein AAVH_17954 [Aphelenchus avenae]
MCSEEVHFLKKASVMKPQLNTQCSMENDPMCAACRILWKRTERMAEKSMNLNWSFSTDADLTT